MYDNLPVLRAAIIQGHMRVSEDRALYDELFGIVETYAAGASLTFTNVSAKNLLMQERPVEYTTLQVESLDPAVHAQNLATAIYEKTGNVTTRAKLFVGDYRVSMSARDIVLCKKKTSESDTSVVRAGLYARVEVRCQGPDLVIMDAAETLSDPSRYKEWVETMEGLGDLGAQFMEDTLSSLAQVTGGGDGGAWHKARRKLLTHFAPTAVMLNAKTENAPLQFIVQTTLSDARTEIEKLIEHADVRNHSLEIPDRDELRKLVVKTNAGKSGKLSVVATVFGVARTHVISYSRKFHNNVAIKIPTAPVTIWFAMINLWHTLQLHKRGVIQEYHMRQEVTSIVEVYGTALRKLVYNYVGAEYDKIFPTTPADYFGQSLALKKFGDMAPAYFPAASG
jgi:hypothetical protein